MDNSYSEREKGTERVTMERITDIDPDITGETEPLTTILAVKCPDGIVMVSDSQATVRAEKMKTLAVTKIFSVNNFISVGGSGDADNIALFVDHLKHEFSDMSPNESEFRDKLQNAFWYLHKKYNLDARQYLGPNANPFNPILLVGAKNGDDTFGLYLLKNNGMVYPKNEHVVIGSGGDLARLVIKQLNRSMAAAGALLHDLLLEGVLPPSCYIINEVKESDSQSGGETKVMIIDSKGVRALSGDEVKKNYEEFLNMVILSSATLGIPIEDSKKMWPAV
jgi:20S proteasome alpha/beta subunit